MFFVLLRAASDDRCAFRITHQRPERVRQETTVWELSGEVPLDSRTPARYALAGVLRHLADEVERDAQTTVTSG